MVNIELLRAGELAIRENGTYAPLSGEAWIYALEMTLLGMGMIFAVLAALWLVLIVFKLIFARPAAKGKAKEPQKNESPKIEEASAPAVMVPEATDDAALIARGEAFGENRHKSRKNDKIDAVFVKLSDKLVLEIGLILALALYYKRGVDACTSGSRESERVLYVGYYELDLARGDDSCALRID